MTGTDRRFSARQLSLGVTLCILTGTTAVWPQTDGGVSLGLRLGGLIGSTELTDKPNLQAGLVLRRPLSGRLLGELVGGYARLDGDQYASDLAVGELRFLFAARSGKMRPVVYAGVGAVRYNLATSPPGRTADIDPVGTAGTVPVGLGYQYVLGSTKALEVLGSYTYTLADEINGAIYEQGNDVFWGITVGLVFGAFGPRTERPPPAPAPRPVAPPAVVVVAEPVGPVEEPMPEPVAEPMPPTPVAAAPPAPTPVPESTTAPDLSFAPVFFATGSTRLSPNGRSLIAEISRAVERHAVVLLEVRGYADTRGSQGRNLWLAQQRAAAVKAALVDAGIEGWRITVRAVGETTPVTEGVWLSRRVEIVPVE